MSLLNWSMFGGYIVLIFIINQVAKYLSPDAKASIIKYLEQTNYFENMNEIDLKVRNCKTQSECKHKYIKGLRNPSASESKFIFHIVNEHVMPLLDKYKLLTNIPWKFCIHADKHVEGNMPHTHADVIVLPEYYVKIHMDKQTQKTIIHERIHIFQRLYPINTYTILSKYGGFNIECNKDTLLDKKPMRTNPDTNNLIMSSDKKELITATYNNNPISLTDIIDKRDHPFELMAYTLTDYILQKDTLPYENLL